MLIWLWGWMFAFGVMLAHEQLEFNSWECATKAAVLVVIWPLYLGYWFAGGIW